MSKIYKEIRLWDDGRLTVAKTAGYAAHYNQVMYSTKGYNYTSCLDKKSHIKRAKKMLCKNILKISEKKMKSSKKMIDKISQALQKLA